MDVARYYQCASVSSVWCLCIPLVCDIPFWLSFLIICLHVVSTLSWFHRPLEWYSGFPTCKEFTKLTRKNKMQCLLVYCDISLAFSLVLVTTIYSVQQSHAWFAVLSFLIIGISLGISFVLPWGRAPVFLHGFFRAVSIHLCLMTFVDEYNVYKSLSFLAIWSIWCTADLYQNQECQNWCLHFIFHCIPTILITIAWGADNFFGSQKISLHSGIIVIFILTFIYLRFAYSPARASESIQSANLKSRTALPKSENRLKAFNDILPGREEKRI